MKSKSVLILSFTLAVAATGRCAAGDYVPFYFCENKTLTISPPSGSPAEIVGDQVVFSSSARDSWASFRLTNKSASPIIQFAAAIEILGDDQKHLLTLEVRNVAPGAAIQPPALPNYLSLGDTGDFVAAVFPFDTADIVSSSPKVITTCPNTARLVWMQIDFLSGDPFNHVFPGFRTDPRLLPVQLSTLNAPPPSPDLLGTVTVNENGKAHLAYMEGDALTLGWVENLISKLKFVPANFAGHSLQDSMTVLFRFHRERQVDWNGVARFGKETVPFTVVDVYPAELRKKNPTVLYGGRILN